MMVAIVVDANSNGFESQQVFSRCCGLTLRLACDDMLRGHSCKLIRWRFSSLLAASATAESTAVAFSCWEPSNGFATAKKTLSISVATGCAISVHGCTLADVNLLWVRIMGMLESDGSEYGHGPR